MKPAIALTLLLATGCGGATESAHTEVAPDDDDALATSEAAVAATGPTVEELTALATEAWVFGYPGVYQRDEMVRATATDELNISAPLNTFGGASAAAGPDDRFVSINNDSLYHMLQADVGDEPLVLNVPATGDRYLVLQFVDAWTNNFAYLGTRGTAGQAGKYLLAGPGWSGETPEGVTLVRAPTRYFTIVGRIAFSDARDIRRAARVQEQIWVTPLSAYPERPEAERALGDREIAPHDGEVPESLVFWEKLRAWMAANPVPESQREYVTRFAPLGLLAEGAESPYRNAPPELGQALTAGLEAGQQALMNALTNQQTTDNGWNQFFHGFDYNRDHFGPGTIDSDAWKIADPIAAFRMRALAARLGLWGNHGYEAAYAGVFVDSDGQPLSGEHRYELTFESEPPVDAFWSITMYDHPNYWLVDNPIDRYSVGDRTRGLRRGRDGSLTIVISHEAPPRAERANWLPAPEGRFRPILRMYLPKEAILDDSWVIPAIRRVDTDAE